MIDEWGYPGVGVVIAPTPWRVHTAVMLDYSECGPAGEPRVIHVETETAQPGTRVLAPNFAAFITLRRVTSNDLDGRSRRMKFRRISLTRPPSRRYL
jgi:hypothetical protein